MKEPTLINYVVTIIFFAVWPGIPLAVIIWSYKHLSGRSFMDKFML